MKRFKGVRAATIQQDSSTPTIKRLRPPKRVVIPLGSRWGNLTPLVKTGKTVRAGQCIARDKNGIIPPAHASISGTVKEIRPWLNFSGENTPSVLIESDGDDTIEKLFQNEGPGQDLQGILKVISEAGIREPDPYPWPLAWRIAQPSIAPQIAAPIAPDLRLPIESLIINGMDRQPGVSVRGRALVYRKKDLLDSILILQKLSGARKTVFAVYKDQAIPQDFERQLKKNWFEIARCPNKYPIALEPVLVRYITGREIPQPSGDARAVGAVVVDVMTALRAHEAVRDGMPSIRTVLQVSAFGKYLDMYVQVREGTLLEDLLEQVRRELMEDLLGEIPPLGKRLAKVIVGGPFLGYTQQHLQVPITQETDAVQVQSDQELTRFENAACVNCGYCVRACPMGLLPNELGKCCEYGRFHTAENKDLFVCIECGICAYVCPVKRPMVHLMRFGKQQLLATREES
jgi:electron transport complex protein RnfC